jgi:hypothetical protein
MTATVSMSQEVRHSRKCPAWSPDFPKGRCDRQVKVKKRIPTRRILHDPPDVETRVESPLICTTHTGRQLDLRRKARFCSGLFVSMIVNLTAAPPLVRWLIS